MTESIETAKSFARWRRRQTFATPEIATHAYLVERDLELLATDAGRIPEIRNLARQNIEAFAALVSRSY